MTEVKTFKEIFEGKPSRAIQAMVEGLRIMDKHPRFVINMGTYGDTEEDEEGNRLCFGCAATCTILRATGKFKLQGMPILDDATSRSEYVQIDEDDLDWFEGAMDALRSSSPRSLFNYMDIDPTEVFGQLEKTGFSITSLRHLGSDNWKDRIGPYKQFAKALQELGY